MSTKQPTQKHQNFLHIDGISGRQYSTTNDMEATAIIIRWLLQPIINYNIISDFCSTIVSKISAVIFAYMILCVRTIAKNQKKQREKQKYRECTALLFTHCHRMMHQVLRSQPFHQLSIGCGASTSLNCPQISWTVLIAQQLNVHG